MAEPRRHQPFTPDEVTAREFATVRRGFEPAEVRAFLAALSDELRAASRREQELRRQLADGGRRLETAEAELAARAETPVIDEGALLAALGSEAAAILRSAHEAADGIRAKAREQAAGIVERGEEEAAEVRAMADGVLEKRQRAADMEGLKIIEAATNEAMAAKAAIEAEAAELAEGNHAKARELVEEALAVRERVLGDLTRRRRAAEIQIEQLRAGHQRLVDAYRLVRRTLDEVTDELQRAEVQTRPTTVTNGQPVQPASGSVPASSRTSAPPFPRSSVAPPPHRPPPARPAVEFPPSRPPTAPDAPSPPDARGSAATSEATDAPVDLAALLSEPPHPPAVPVEVPVAVPDAVRSPPGPPGPDTAQDAPAAEAPPRPPAAPAPAPEAPPLDGRSKPAVDELFARLRASRATTVATVERPPHSFPSSDLPAPGDHDVPRDHDAPGAGQSTTRRHGGAGEVPLSDADEAALQRRDAVLDPLQAVLTRKLKRALQDEQNDLLDRLRSLRQRPTVADVVPDPTVQAERYRTATLPYLGDAAAAGAVFIGGSHTGAVHGDLADELAEAIIAPLRTRIERALADDHGDDTRSLADDIGAAYREWKAQRIEDRAGDVLHAAFGRGLVASIPAGTPLRWIVDDQSGPCPDCDDNALARPTPAGAAYPTGQVHPPAHTGCRCLLVRHEGTGGDGGQGSTRQYPPSI